MKIIAVGGGSGGHVTPVLVVLNQLHLLDENLEARFVCDAAFEPQARGLMKHATVPVQVTTIMAGKFRRYSHLTFWQHFTVPQVVFKNTTDIVKIAIGFIQSLWLLLWHRPDVVFAKGGYVSLPFGIATWVLRIPLVIHDSDTRPGLTNRILSRFATRIATGSPLENYPYDRTKTSYIGVPIDAEFVPVSQTRQSELKKSLGLDPDKKLVVATGGGLGAPNINLALVKAARVLGKKDIFIYNVTGKRHFDDVAALITGMKNYTAVPFIYEKMYDVLGAADVVVSRASATFLQELAGLGKAVIAVPARQLGDQLKNAEVYKKADAAIVMTDSDISIGDSLESTLVALLDDDKRRQTLGDNLHTFARPGAARDLAQLIIDAVK